MFENLSSSEWLMYISEWTYNNQQTSNIRVTTKVAVHSLLSDLPALQERGDRHHPQPGLQGGKIRGLYLISLPVVITPGFLAAFCKLRTRYSIDTLFRFVFSENV
jgi:hypothetical protein